MNQIIEHRKLNKKEKMILTNHLIKVCRDLHWIETDSDKAVFITEPFLGYSSISHLKHIITMFYIIRSRLILHLVMKISEMHFITINLSIV